MEDQSDFEKMSRMSRRGFIAALLLAPAAAALPAAFKPVVEEVKAIHDVRWMGESVLYRAEPGKTLKAGQLAFLRHNGSVSGEGPLENQIGVVVDVHTVYTEDGDQYPAAVVLRHGSIRWTDWNDGFNRLAVANGRVAEHIHLSEDPSQLHKYIRSVDHGSYTEITAVQQTVNAASRNS